MTVRPLTLGEIRSFTFNGYERVMQNPDGPPTGRQLLALWHEGALAIVHPDAEAHVFSRAEAAWAISWLKGDGE